MRTKPVFLSAAGILVGILSAAPPAMGSPLTCENTIHMDAGTGAVSSANYGSQLDYEKQDMVPAAGFDLQNFDAAGLSYEHHWEVSDSSIPSNYTAGATLDIAVNVQPDAIRISAQAAGSSTCTSFIPNFINGDANFTNVTAGFNDVLILQSASAPPGAFVQLEASLLFHGKLAASHLEGGDNFPSGAAKAVAYLSGNGLANAPYPPSGHNTSPYWALVLSQTGLQDVNDPPFPYEPVIFTLQVGQPYLVGYSLRLDGFAQANTYGRNGTVDLNFHTQDASAFLSADFSNTLAWGGITSVTDVATGQPLADWSVSSASGFDYSQAYVPEPCGLALLLLGLGGVLRRSPGGGTLFARG